MALYLVFNTELEAQAANQTIFDAAIPLYNLMGYPSDTQGLIGKVKGVVNPFGGRTSAWDIPKQPLDGKWLILDPSAHPAAQTILPDSSKAIDIMNAALGVVVRELDPENGTWFVQGAP